MEGQKDKKDWSQKVMLLVIAIGVWVNVFQKYGSQ